MRYLFVALGGLSVLAVAGLYIYERWMDPQLRIESENMARFPTVKGSSLSGKEFVFPQDIEGDVAIVMIAFTQEQQLDVNTWLPLAERIAAENDAVAYYELPTVFRGTVFFRNWLDGVMRAGIPSQGARDTTVTLYVDVAAFQEALEIPDSNEIQVMLIDQSGDVLWRTDGPLDSDKQAGLEAIINSDSFASTE